MANAVLTLTQQEIDKLKEMYSSFLQPTNPPGSLFVAKATNCTITAYRSGKVLFQGKNAEQEAKKWGQTKANTTTPTNKQSRKKKESSHKFEPPKNISEISVIGSDEAGTGDYFGPITVAAAFVAKDKFTLMKELGVKDSKALTDIQIAEIAKKIVKIIPYSLLILHNPKYNELQQKGYNQGKMKAILHNKAIHNVASKIQGTVYDGILIDQFCQPEVYFNYLKGQSTNLSEKIYFQTKAESISLSVAAASIIARYAFVKEMDTLSERVGFTLPKGASSTVDQTAAKLIQTRGLSSLHDFAKTHFANTEKAKRY